MRVLLTGGAGFLGGFVSEELLHRGHGVTVLDDLSSGDIENVPSCVRPGFIRSDIMDEAELTRAMENNDYVIHLAGLVNIQESFRHPERYDEVNASGTLNVLKAAARRGIKGIALASTCAVYGQPDNLPVAETQALRPQSPYAQSKINAERYCESFCKSGLNVAILRIFNAYGPKQTGTGYSGVISEFMRRIKTGLQPLIYGDGGQTRDFVYASDVASCFVNAAQSHACGTFNVGTGHPTSLNELERKLTTLMKSEGIRPIHENPRPGEPREIYSDVGKTSRALGWSAIVDINTGLERTLRGQYRNPEREIIKPLNRNQNGGLHEVWEGPWIRQQ